ncbi:hypothetical protein BN2475_450120 [Paraburkholderia ribeironis]|uniref:Uncharacterized protein n=2 Tax=Paraburkholderia ribeironis TaxID=1247936 RepID=A0A1N7S965_9BURK|nr:hypothetical protein BN2475_450120 [Paraburkholderia ribeironis]
MRVGDCGPGGANHILLAAIVIGASHRDVTQPRPLFDTHLAMRERQRRSLQKALALHADHGDDPDPERQPLRERGIKPGCAIVCCNKPFNGVENQPREMQLTNPMVKTTYSRLIGQMRPERNQRQKSSA